MNTFRWSRKPYHRREYSETLLKRLFESTLKPPVVEEGNETIYYCTAEPKIQNPKQEEIDNIINKLKKNKAHEKNFVVAKLLKKCGTEIRKKIMEMISFL